MQTLRLELGAGNHPADACEWVYAWVVDGAVEHVGCTWMHPAARAELHLHQPTDDARSLALRAAVGPGGGRAVILGFCVPPAGHRQAYKAALEAACAERGWVPAAAAVRPEPLDEPWVAEAVAAIALELAAEGAGRRP